jgi:hypothetical protein
MAGTERGGVRGLLVADGTLCRTDGVITERGTLGAFSAFLEIGADGVHGGAVAAEVAIAFSVHAHVMMLWADVLAKVNGVEISRDPHVGCLRTNDDCPRGTGDGLLHGAYLQGSEK